MSAKARFSFRELGEAAQDAARCRLLDKMENLPWHEKATAQFVVDAGKVGVNVIPGSVRFSKDSASFSASDVNLPVVLDYSGIGRKFLSAPEDFDLFCAYAMAEIRQVYPDSPNAQLLSVSVEMDSLYNLDGGRVGAVCDVAADHLERYLKNLAMTLAVHLHELLSAEHERMASRNFLDGILETMGAVFTEKGAWEASISLDGYR
ncbi:MAG: hypothetical protein IKW79_00095 [Schwartzia sp.]|nr:hypothetical protein [Schwartzia sp. (in: firmicutes)]